MKASEELPSVNKMITSRKCLKRLSMPLRLKTGSVDRMGEAVSRAPSARTRTARTAGRMLARTTTWKVLRERLTAWDWVSQTMRAAMPMPRKAPKVSPARCRPKARPRCFSLTPSATRASRGAVRMPLPRRSLKRTARTQPHELAK